MKKVHLLFIALIVLAICVMVAYRCHNEGRNTETPQATLKIVFNGVFAITFKKSDPSRIIVFSPRDPNGVHKFYFNDLGYDHDKKTNYHFTLKPDGLKTASAPTLIDPELSDFTADTDLWVREEYFVTVELPAPDEITFVPPTVPVTFENGTTGNMSTNYILEYRVKDLEKIKLVSPELPDARPLSSAELQKQFADLCGSPVGRRVHDSCIEMRNLLSKYSRPGTSLFFFGVGLSVMEESKLSRFDEDYHAVTFFNDVLLKSFPHLTDKRLAPMAKSGREGEGSARGMLMPAVLQVQSTRLRLLPVSAVIDCKVGGIIVTVMQ